MYEQISSQARCAPNFFVNSVQNHYGLRIYFGNRSVEFRFLEAASRHRVLTALFYRSGCSIPPFRHALDVCQTNCSTRSAIIPVRVPVVSQVLSASLPGMLLYRDNIFQLICRSTRRKFAMVDMPGGLAEPSLPVGVEQLRLSVRMDQGRDKPAPHMNTIKRYR